MTYPLVAPPIAQPLRELPRKELLAYARWFLESIPARVYALQQVVRATPGHDAWSADSSVESLEPLDLWFEKQVEVRPRSPEELAEIRAGLRFPVDVSDNTLTYRTLSLAFDIGMYWGLVILENVPGTSWKQELRGGRSNVDYGHVVIRGNGLAPLNPFDVIRMTALGVVDGRRTGLPALYLTWREELLSR
jgi:hypothetical protein